jgi:hypothetical protein
MKPLDHTQIAFFAFSLLCSAATRLWHRCKGSGGAGWLVDMVEKVGLRVHPTHILGVSKNYVGCQMYYFWRVWQPISPRQHGVPQGGQ